MSSAGKLGRNDSCSCGSGKKFKRCCIGKAGTQSGPKAWGVSAFLLVAGLVGGALVFSSKGLGPALAVLAASVLFAVGVYVIRDPAPRRELSGDASAINFGNKR